MKHKLIARLLTGVLIFTALLAALPASAQDANPIRLSGAFTITVPQGWTIDRYLTSGYFWHTGASTLRIRSYSPVYQDYHGVHGVDNLMEYLVTETYETREFDPAQVQPVQIGEHQGSSYTYEENVEGNRYFRTIFLYALENGFVMFGTITPVSGHDLNEGDVEDLKTALGTITLQNTFEFYEGTVLAIPEGWQLTHDNNDRVGAVGLKNDTYEFALWLWPGYGAMEGLEQPADFLAYVHDANWSTIESFDPSKLQPVKIAGVDAVLFPYSTQTVNAKGRFDRAVLAFTFSTNNSMFTVQIQSQSLDDSLDPIYEILDTLQPGRKPVCALFADPGIRIRERPDASSAVVRETGEETLVATRQAVDSANYTWFDVGEGWIRSDVIYHENTSCASLPMR